MAKRRGRSRFASQAALEALVRFGPEMSGLKELQRTALSNFDLGVHQAHGSADAIVGAVDQAKPGLAKVYDNAGLKQAGLAGTLIGHDIAGLGPIADSIKAGASLEATGAADRLNLAKTQALTDLSSRKVRAREGEQFAIGNAKNQLVSELTKILNRKQDLSREKGAFAAATINDLSQAAADQAFKATENAKNRKNSQIVAGVNPDGTPIPGGPKDPALKPGKPKKINTDLQHGTLDDGVSGAQTLIGSQFVGEKRQDIYTDLVNGVPSSTVTLKDGTKQKVPEIAKHSPLVARAAIELYFDKKISRKTLDALHKHGYSVKKLGWKYASGKPPTRNQATKNLTNTAVDVTQGIAQILAGIKG